MADRAEQGSLQCENGYRRHRKRMEQGALREV